MPVPGALRLGAPGVGAGRGWVVAGRRRPGAAAPTRAAPAARLPAATREAAYGEKGTCRGCSPAAVGASTHGTSAADRFRAVPRTDTPGAAPTHNETNRATRTPPRPHRPPQASRAAQPPTVPAPAWSSRPVRAARAAASSRDPTPSFISTRWTCVRAVDGAMPMPAAISLVSLAVGDPDQDLHLPRREHLQQPLPLVVGLGRRIQQLTERPLQQRRRHRRLPGPRLHDRPLDALYPLVVPDVPRRPGRERRRDPAWARHRPQHQHRHLRTLPLDPQHRIEDARLGRCRRPQQAHSPAPG